MTASFQSIIDSLDSSFRITLTGFDLGCIKHQWDYTAPDGKQYGNWIETRLPKGSDVTLVNGLHAMISDAIQNFVSSMTAAYGLETGHDLMKRYIETGIPPLVPSEEDWLRQETRRRYGI